MFNAEVNYQALKYFASLPPIFTEKAFLEINNAFCDYDASLRYVTELVEIWGKKYGHNTVETFDAVRDKLKQLYEGKHLHKYLAVLDKLQEDRLRRELK